MNIAVNQGVRGLIFRGMYLIGTSSGTLIINFICWRFQGLIFVTRIIKSGCDHAHIHLIKHS